MKLPSEREIEALHRKYSPHSKAFEMVYRHCQVVAEIAGEIIGARGPEVDPELVRTGALLHDIGVYRVYGSDGLEDDAIYLRHGVLGAAVLRQEGLPEV